MFFDEQRLGHLLQEREADGLLALTPSNIFYLTGFAKSGGAAAFVSGGSSNHPRLVVPSSNIDFIIEDVSERVQVVAYGRFPRALAEDESWDTNERRIADLHRGARTEASRDSVLVSILRDFRGTLLCDLDRDGTALTAAFDGIDIRSDPGAFKWLRMVKDAEESGRLRVAAEVTEAAIEAVAAACEEGVAQETLTRAFCTSLAGSGAQLRLVHISLGRSGAFGNANVPGDRLGTGNTVKLDVGAVVAGYASDVARCFSLGAPSGKARAYYDALVAGQEAAFELLHPGTRACDVFDRAVEAVRSHGIPHYDRTNVGHGIGVDGDGYDPPLLGPADETLLEAGMVLCIETPYYEIGFGGLQVEDMVLVTDDGIDSLTVSARDMWSIG